MTQAVKEQILYTWKLVGKLHNILDTRVLESKKTGYAEFFDLLEQYQSAVIGVGETLEKNMGIEERQNLIAELEEYCEGIYQLSQSVEIIEAYYKQSGKLLKKYEELTVRLEKLSVKKTALFLPYKFSMWDSLESIYFAVKEDSEWEAVVMPIPYIEREKDKHPKPRRPSYVP